jgi:hypothetical protein
MNLGNNPRVFGAEEGNGVIASLMPRRHLARNHRPSYKMVNETLLRCLPIWLTHCEGWKQVASRFDDAMKEEKGAAAGEMHVCGTPLCWMKSALSPSYDVASVRLLENIMGAQGMMPGVGDFFLMDAILNRKLVCSNVDAPPCNPDDVVMASAKSDVANLGPDRDFVYRLHRCSVSPWSRRVLQRPRATTGNCWFGEHSSPPQRELVANYRGCPLPTWQAFLVWGRQLRASIRRGIGEWLGFCVEGFA